MIMNDKRQIEVFIAGWPVCDDAISLVNRIACPSCEVTTLDMKTSEVADRAKALGIRSIPAVVIDGKVADWCQKGFPYEWEILKDAGLGQPLPKTWKEPFIQTSPFAFTTGIFKPILAFINGKAYIKKHLAIYQRSSALSVSEYKGVSCSDQMGAKTL